MAPRQTMDGRLPGLCWGVLRFPGRFQRVPKVGNPFFRRFSGSNVERIKDRAGDKEETIMSILWRDSQCAENQNRGAVGRMELGAPGVEVQAAMS